MISFRQVTPKLSSLPSWCRRRSPFQPSRGEGHETKDERIRLFEGDLSHAPVIRSDSANRKGAGKGANSWRN